MSGRVLLVTVALLALVSTGDAFAQKTKIKADTPQTTIHQPQQPQQTPPQQSGSVDPDDIEQILDDADAAYFVDDGQTPDYKRAFELYSLAAGAGDPYAMNRVGLMYDRGEHVDQDFGQAFEWYLKAAEAGLPSAQSNVGSMYSAGDGVRQDYAEAVRWFRQAAENGYGYAMYSLGDMYLGGTGVAKDAEEAAAWYQKASDAGDANGHWALSLRYLYGDGVGKDSQRAAELAYLALTNGLQVAMDEFKEIGSADTSPNYRRAIQELLKRDGYYDGGIDGSFGPGTQRAIEAAFGSAL
jgi:TPR repeat protein